ncbi:MAG: hypothetical protein QOE70_4642 [Chthoniobacter sp.]|jgi:hypothetical protein|nr:hypothetical protein [Chthoniobacter sp.]
MADVFISYAREDQEFVRRLSDGLAAAGREAWVDWTNIPPTVEWLTEIFAGIEGTAVFVILISPESVGSAICQQEIAHAVEHHKRLVPILHRAVEDGATMPPVLKTKNWIFLGPDEDLTAKLPELLRAIETDWDWVNQHKRLTTRAVEWRNKDQDASLLLRGADLSNAERWLAQAREAAAGEERRPTQVQTEYIATSRQAASNLQRKFLIGTAATLAVVAVLAVVAYLQREEAGRQRNAAVRQQKIAEERQAEAERQSRIALSRQLAAQA